MRLEKNQRSGIVPPNPLNRIALPEEPVMKIVPAVSLFFLPLLIAGCTAVE